jgi:hypothetical protein
LRQKLAYIHNNPIAGEFPLVDDRADYSYSSAGFYDRGVPAAVPVTDIWLWYEGEVGG